jgi:hypothetical protein
MLAFCLVFFFFLSLSLSLSLCSRNFMIHTCAAAVSYREKTKTYIEKCLLIFTESEKEAEGEEGEKEW